ncbi:MAG: site-2 protease family protein [Clostridiales bacterium]|jgi:Zn-dependent protease|nr:site-2 protease family protein [Clostridiales bacterium]
MFLGNYLYRVPALLLAVTLHELAHGWVAYRLGDDTAKSHGRLTLNPLAHIDPIGLLALFLVGFGWAKPVPVNPMYFKGDRHRGMFLVGLAGPVTNFILAFITLFILGAFPSIGAVPHLPDILVITFRYNVLLGVFNLLPFPPLDGSKVLAYFLPRSFLQTFHQIEQYGPVILIVLIFSGVLWRILSPLINAASNIIFVAVSLLLNLL